MINITATTSTVKVDYYGQISLIPIADFKVSEINGKVFIREKNKNLSDKDYLTVVAAPNEFSNPSGASASDIINGIETIIDTAIANTSTTGVSATITGVLVNNIV